jgi:hypothetical protein
VFSSLELQKGLCQVKELSALEPDLLLAMKKEVHISATVLETQPVDITYLPWWIQGLGTYRS